MNNISNFLQAYLRKSDNSSLFYLYVIPEISNSLILLWILYYSIFLKLNYLFPEKLTIYQFYSEYLYL